MTALISLLCLAPLAWTADLSGVLFDADGKPILDATITVGAAPQPTQDTTDRDGAFLLTVPAGTWPVRVQIPGRAPLAIEPIPFVDGEVTELLLTLAPQGSLIVLAELPAVRELTLDADAATGTLEGRVVDERGKPIADARVFVRGQPVEARSDAQGRFSLTLPAATHEISVLRSGFSTRSMADISVPPDGRAEITVELIEAGVMMEEYVVLIPRISGGTSTLLAERQDSSELVDTVSAEEMSRRGDTSAAAALQRVTGLTVVGGKYVYVRGLGERYSSTLMNGASLPSPEPERRVVPLDLFPTAMLDSVVIQKTFSPSMPAEFGGGVVRLRTRGVPDDPLFTVSLSGNYQHNTTFQQGLTGFDPGPNDFWGFGADYRTLPQEVQDAAEAEPLALKSTLPGSRGYDAETLEALGEAMPNRWGLTPTTALPDLSTSVVTGRGWDIGEDSRIGILSGVTFSNGWQLTDYHVDYLTPDGDNDLRVLNEYDFRDTENQIRLGGLIEVAADITDNHSVRSTTLLTRDTESAAREYIGYNNDIGTDIRVQRLRWVERQLLVQQFSGEHTLPDFAKNIGVTWRYSIALADRAEPDRRDVLQIPDETTGEWRMRSQSGGNALFFSVLDDINHDAGVDLSLPFGDTESKDATFGGSLDVGGNIVRRERTVDTRRFGYIPKGSSETDYLVNEPQDIFTDDNIEPELLQFEEQTLATDNYVANQELEGVYISADTALPGRINLLGGVRREHSRQEVRTFQLFTTEPVEEIADLETTDWLPAATITHRIGTLRKDQEESRTQIRAGYGKTLSRPDFRELSPAVFNDVVGGREVAGNSELQRATIDNYDLRWEFYPSSNESLSIGAFYKHFTSPIESIVLVGAVSRISYANAESADNVGTEIEFRKSLGFGSEPPAWLADTYLSGNAAIIRSQIDLGDAGGNQTSSVRALQGQSPYVLNLQLTYEGLESPLSFALLYNVFGPRIAEVGEGGLPDTYEQPVHRVDASASVRLGDAWRVKVSGRNLLDAPSRLTIGDQTVSEIQTGWSLGLGLTWTPDLDRPSP